jgi:molybdopterin synthase sulfurtransferase
MIVDVRALSTYNGWRPSGEARGGHIPGAAAFPSAWVARLDAGEVVRLLRSKDIVPGREIVLCGDGPDDALGVASRLAELAHAALRVYEQGWGEWAADETLPVERLPNYRRLVHTGWLRHLLDAGRPEAAPAREFLLFQVNVGLPRSTRRTTSRGRCTSTPTGSKARPSGTVAHGRSSTRPCARSGSATTRR